MSYLLNGTTIRRPARMREDNSTQFAANRVMSGTNTRDYFGTNKRIWTLEYDNLNVTDFATINTLYQTFLSNESPQTWEITESNYTVALTSVLIDLQTRSFGVPGSSYLSNTTLTLTEV